MRGSGRRSWVEYGAVAALVAAVSAVVYFPVLDPGQPDVAGRFDVYRQFGPWNYFFDRALAEGELAAWNPLTFCGAPHAANPQSWALYPPNLLRSWLNAPPTPQGTQRGLTALMALHLLLWALGVYRLARAHGLPPDAALVGVLASTFGALMVRRVAEWHFLFTLAWLPWMLLSLRQVIQATTHARPGGKDALRPALALALCFALGVLGGFPQILPHIVLTLAAYLAVSLALGWPQAPRRQRGAAAGRALGLCRLSGLLAVGLAAVLLLPTAELLSLSPRASGSGVEADGYEPEEWNLRYALVSLLVYSGRHYELETLRGAGVIAMALACAALAGKRLRAAAPMFAMLYALVDAMLGPPMPLSLLLGLLTPAQLVSGTRAFDVAMLPLALLAGFGLVALRERPRIAPWIALGVLVTGTQLVRSMHLERDIWASPDASVWVLPAVCALVLAAPSWLPPRGRVAVGALVVLLLGAELMTWNRFYARPMLIKSGYDRHWKGRNGFSGEEPFWADNRRSTSDRPNFSLFTMGAIRNGYDPLHLHAYRKAVLARDPRTYARTLKEKALQRTPRTHLFLKRPFWLVSKVVVGPMPKTRETFAPTEVAFVNEAPPPGVAVVDSASVLGRASSTQTREVALKPRRRIRGGHVTWSASTPELAPVHHTLVATLRPLTSGDLRLYSFFRERGSPRAVPGYRQQLRVEAGHEVEVEFPMPDLRRGTLRIETRNERHEAPRLRALTIREDLADEDRAIRIVRRTANQVEVEIEALRGPRLLAFIDNDYPGWRAQVDGVEVPQVRVNDAFKGVWLGPGDHRVRFWFQSRSLALGAWISLATLLLMTMALVPKIRSAVARLRSSGTDALRR